MEEAAADDASTLTSKGPVTIPKEIRDALDLEPSDKIRCAMEDGEVRLRKASLSLEDVAGSLPPLGMSVAEANRAGERGTGGAIRRTAQRGMSHVVDRDIFVRFLAADDPVKSARGLALCR